MRVRHKAPSFVSMWMLDVFCCALGCVTLLWLLNTRQAGDQTASAKSALTDLTQARSDLKLALTSLDATKLRLTAESQQLTTQLAAVRTEKDELAKKLGLAQGEARSAAELLDATKTALNAAEAKIDASAKELALARDKAADADDVLRKKQKQADVLAKKAADAASTATDLQKLVRQKDDDLAAARKKVDDLQARLDDLDARAADTKKDAVAAKTAAKAAAEELAAVKLTGEKSAADVAAARGQVKELQKKLEAAAATIVDLQGDKAKLADKVDRLDRENDARFAGITVTGKAVVFAVDMSGSMNKLDAETAAPGKWPVVCETVAKVMRTIPNLEKYQVVVFSRQSRWLFGDGEWQAYAGEKSAVAVKDALLKVKPEGDTNLYAAFDLAFGLRPKGLDTVYLFSDGLPTSGPGLTPAQDALDEAKKGEVLAGNLRRKLDADWNRRAAGGDRVKVHAIGFFYESPAVGAFLWALARENDGSFVGMSRP